MSSLDYIGKVPSTSKGVTNTKQVTDILLSGTTREWVEDEVLSQAALKAYKTYVDAQDNLYAETAYYQAQDALLIPTSQRGSPNGVTPLDSDGKIPEIHNPTLGVSTLRGPYGPNEVLTGETGSTPIKIATWNIGITAVAFQPLVFLLGNVTVEGQACPVIEIKIGNPSQTTYESQTLIASGHGRWPYDDKQNIRVVNSRGLGLMSDGTQIQFSPSVNWHMDAWLFDSQNVGTVKAEPSHLAVASVYLMRVS